MTTKLFYLNVETAQRLLRTLPLEKQRLLYWPAVYSYLKKMEDKEEIRAIEIEDGELVNGQHRVMAFLLSGLKQYFFKIN
jgi:hypothetical protein